MIELVEMVKKKHFNYYKLWQRHVTVAKWVALRPLF